MLLFSCNQSVNNNEAKTTPATILRTLPLKYAKAFSVDYYEGYKVISVKDAQDSLRLIAQYILAPKTINASKQFPDAILLNTPTHKIVCVSTTHMSEMSRLNLVDSIAGITNVPLVYDDKIVANVKQGSIVDLGNDEMNYEKLVELNPSFVITSGGYDGGDKLKLKLTSLHINSVIDLDYKEQDPLARAEWLKFIAAFFDKENEADSIFNGIETNYLALKQKANDVKIHPTVFCNIPFKEIWYMPCGENYIAKLIDDAGGDFLWKDAKATNGLNLNLDYEAVYNKAANADFWINPGFALSLEEIKAADKKNTFFKAYKVGSIYNNNKRNTPAAGFDFWNSGIVNPDKILADLIFIFHPELLPGHELYYYQKLK